MLKKINIYNASKPIVSDGAKNFFSIWRVRGRMFSSGVQGRSWSSL